MKKKFLLIQDDGATKSVISSHSKLEAAEKAIKNHPTSNSVFLLTYQLMMEEEWEEFNSPPYIPSED
ncbi:MAG: hypothetical protein GW941_00550 [Candidatus Pacebacteria bacterium]|nr:hypothetical protein [Candidatus Paceibacterota bacterium]